MGKTGARVESVVKSQFLLWAAGAQSYWGALRASGEHATEVSPPKGWGAGAFVPWWWWWAAPEGSCSLAVPGCLVLADGHGCLRCMGRLSCYESNETSHNVLILVCSLSLRTSIYHIAIVGKLLADLAGQRVFQSLFWCQGHTISRSRLIADY